MAEAGPSRPLSDLSALFLTHFDDIKGQTVLFYESTGVPQEGIEHASLPSGLHLLDRDAILFRHHASPGVGVFRSRQVEGGRGRVMGTLGVVLGREKATEDLWELQGTLEELLDELEGLGSPLQKLGGEDDGVRKRLGEVWESSKAKTGGAGGGGDGARDEMDRVRRLVDGKVSVDGSHPVTYLPALLSILGPQLIPVYKAALTAKRILLYATPPLLPLAAFAWCIWAMSLPPSSLSSLRTNGAARDDEETTSPASSSGSTMSWLGNVGLMDLADLKKRRGGWVATTSDAIFRSHQTYDIFLDLSVSPPSLHGPPISSGSSSSSYSGPHISYTLSDLPLYRSLLLLDSSPPGITILPTADGVGDEDEEEHEHDHSHGRGGKEVRKGAYRRIKENRSIYTRQGGWWLLAFDLFNRAWALCVGVCEYATGRGRVGEISLGEGEEDASLLPSGAMPPPGAGEEDDIEGEGDREGREDEAVRRGRLILRQLHHHSYHLLARLRSVAGPTRKETRDRLSDKEVKELVGGKIWGGAGEARFWQDLAGAWGFTRGAA